MLVIIRRNFQNHALLRAIIYILIGLAIAINPGGFFNFVGYLITGYLALIGLVNIFEDLKNRKNGGVFGVGLFSGIFFLILALIVWLFSKEIVSILPILLGLGIICNGLFQLVLGLNLKSTGWIIYSVILLVLGFVLIFNPFKSVLLLFQAFGVILIFMGVLEGFSFFKFKNSQMID